MARAYPISEARLREPAVLNRFWRYVDQDGPVPEGTAAEGNCWDWRPALASGDYGRFNLDNRPYKAHRIAWVMAHGPIPDGLLVDHICQRPTCVRAAHLRLVTEGQNHQNLRRESAKGASGLRGVVRDGATGRWYADVGAHGERTYGPKRATVAEAAADVRALRLELHTHNDVDRLPTA